LILGAEKLKPELARDIKETLGIDPLEGYGCTELSPVVAVNVPRDVELPDGRVIAGNRLGTVGMPLPGTAVKTIDCETGADLPKGAEGMIAVKGPQVMVGYLDRPEETAQAIKGGWYMTGDIGYLDADGFLKITDRASRFSKIAGEMVPHVGIESAIMDVTGVDEHHVAVTCVPDPPRSMPASTRGRCPRSGSLPRATSSMSRRSPSPRPAKSTCGSSARSL
jgi:acyl-[acyl-carrier-protein]-phospholipid O-acyltransferase/long-chain-fatty-acid--[acyl-carrier-protein] ligase